MFLALALALSPDVQAYDEFADQTIPEAADASRTSDIGELIFERFVIPFEVVSVVLLAALIGGIVLARRDPGEGETEAVR